MVFILGGLVVAVAGIGFFLYSNGSLDGAGTPASGGDVSISIDNGSAGSDEVTPPEVTPDAPVE